MPAKSKDGTAAYFLHSGSHPAPVSLPRPAKALWVRIMRTTPADQFREGDLPLLAAYCRTAALADEAMRHLERDGQVDAAGKPSPWGRIASEHAKSLAALSAKLRLCPSSRIRAESGALRQQPAFGRGAFDVDDDPDGLLAQ